MPSLKKFENVQKMLKNESRTVQSVRGRSAATGVSLPVPPSKSGFLWKTHKAATQKAVGFDQLNNSFAWRRGKSRAFRACGLWFESPTALAARN